MTLPEVLQRPLTVAVVASPMFIASGPELVSAQCRAGVIGSFPALNARPASQLRDWLAQLEEELAAFDSLTAAAEPFNFTGVDSNLESKLHGRAG